MAIRKLQEVGGGSTGVTLPKDDLVLEDILNDEGELEGAHFAHVTYEGEGEWSLQLIDLETDE
ncbi:hypothetical protein [Natrarchaeobaculum sulfurireducens]|uniref:DUF8053 domain-containing protein n=1 Tax=Natrarchaeobaculum sulfurireducens TaxID=2044521 RepID=A0A346PG47_9EURY|nr:hypothetical protein [Natrarchaeobaculum sulfurireducens]AXR78492.1 hypothetical protein AArc1_2176 [Natrarchaeobaculum sulfurireducens]